MRLMNGYQKNGKVSNFRARIFRKLFYMFISLFERATDEFGAYVTRPKWSEGFIQEPLSEAGIKIGIILQGAILKANNFTLETVKLYKRIMPHAIIIISTWKNEDDYIIDKFEQLGIEVVKSEEPLCNGIQNINMQVVSSKEGIRHARKLGCEYVMKTRTDQRFYRADLDSFCLSLIETFPRGHTFINCKMRNRMVVLQGTVGINILQPFYISDFMYFGTTDDVDALFSYPLETESFDSKDLKAYLKKTKDGVNIGEYLRKVAPEVKLLEHYVKTNIDKDFEYTVEYFWRIMKECFITVSNEETGLFWPKYKSRFYENNLLLNYLNNVDSGLKRTETWSFSTWLNLYYGRLCYKEELEEFKNQPA